MSTQTNRFRWIDICRIVCTWGVICIHTRGIDYYSLDYSTKEFVTCLFWGQTFVFCVPVFLMLSGILMLDREISIKRIVTKYLPKAFGLKVMSLLISSFLCILFYLYYGDFRKGSFVKFILEYDSGTYFLAILAMCYLITPILHHICQNRKLEEYLLGLSLIFSILFPVLSKVPGLNYIVEWIGNTGQVYFPLGMMLYFLLGHYVNKYITTPSKYRTLIMVLLANVMYVSVEVYIHRNQTQLSAIMEVYYGYVSWGIVIYSVLAMLFFKSWFSETCKYTKIEKIIKIVSQNTFFIWILHGPLVTLIGKYITPKDFEIYSVGVILETTFIFVLGLFLSCIVSKVVNYIKIFNRSGKRNVSK